MEEAALVEKEFLFLLKMALILNTIVIRDFAADTLNTREAAREILRLIETNPCEVNEIDFTGVEFMSRSFADEFHKEKIRLQEKYSIKIIIVNAVEEITEMLHRVANTQNVTERKKSDVPVFKFKEPAYLYNYLQTI